tara:strand:- start:190 stop:834 length:645 start_codon:yes stop_codon:yes gene_type:complete
MKTTSQIKEWDSIFGKEYTDRNLRGAEGTDEWSNAQFGITRTKMNNEFLGTMDRSMAILEVGANIGNQLGLLQKMGFGNLTGLELQSYAIEIGGEQYADIKFIKGSVLDIPFPDNSFDLVFSSFFLIHISPEDLKSAMKQIYRCARKYIWGFEYYNENLVEIPYRDKINMMWKADYATIYQDYFPDLNMIKKENYMYLGNDNNDCMFLLRKSNG